MKPSAMETKTKRLARWSRESWEDAPRHAREAWLTARGVPREKQTRMAGLSWGAVNSSVLAQRIRKANP